MKKTLTVNLGGTVFHIDEDAYLLLDKYLSNLKFHFKKEEGAEEIVKDIELRISELFSEKVNAGVQVISIDYVEEVIARVGKPEELSANDEEKKDTDGQSASNTADNKEYTQPHRHFFRNPDDTILGGVAGGLAAYLGWDATAIRLALILLMIFGVGTIIPIYIVCWIIVPVAHTAAEKLAMRGESVTVENIGKTVTDGFEKFSDGVNDYVKSGKPRTFFEKLGDLLVQVIGVCIKIVLILFAVAISPVLLLLILGFVIVICFAIAMAVGGTAALYSMIPSVDWSVISCTPTTMIIASIAGVLLVGIPLASILYSVFCKLLEWKPMSTPVKWALVVLWVIGLIVSVILFSNLPELCPGLLHHSGLYFHM